MELIVSSQRGGPGNRNLHDRRGEGTKPLGFRTVDVLLLFIKFRTRNRDLSVVSITGLCIESATFFSFHGIMSRNSDFFWETNLLHIFSPQ